MTAVTDLELGAVPAVATRPPPPAGGPLQWLRANLFSSPANAVVTLLCALFLVWALPPLIRWLFIDAVWTGEDRTACVAPDAGACWAFVSAKFGQFIYGRYPPEEIRLAHAVQVVKREHRDDQIERPIRQRVLKPLDEQVHATSRQHAPSTSQHLATCVDADQVRSRIRFEHASRTLAGARA